MDPLGNSTIKNSGYKNKTNDNANNSDEGTFM